MEGEWLAKNAFAKRVHVCHYTFVIAYSEACNHQHNTQMDLHKMPGHDKKLQNTGSGYIMFNAVAL